MSFNHFVHVLLQVLYLYRCNVCMHGCVRARARAHVSAGVWVGGVCWCACTVEREGRRERRAGVHVSVGVR